MVKVIKAKGDNVFINRKRRACKELNYKEEFVDNDKNDSAIISIV
jgi:hypothetical protein